ncbi:hypothetical protein B6U99_06000 [Candidatus Geothermarchaeota archaeon ex4572_27]|nr:MAG: hypothetical protein B6U99_06000 [Candidatus Geothermarchaeota archaeon ex4572_27]
MRLESSKGGVETIAPLNTGFTTDTLDIYVPHLIAEDLGLWPPPNAVLEALDTAGGEILSYFIPNSVKLTVVEPDRASKTVLCNAIVSTHEREVLLSDAVIEELEIEILSPKTGLWRFKGEAKVRKGVQHR